MTTVRVGIGMIWVVSFFAGRMWPVPPVASPNTATSAEITVQPHTAATDVGSAPLMEGSDLFDHRDPATDLFGNEIEEAIADYRIDLGGTVYERHSPETAVTKLGSPTT
jgi:hypothetical protein